MRNRLIFIVGAAMLLACHSLTLHCACVCVPFAASSVKYSGMLEADPFPSGGGSHQGTTADYFFMMIFGACIMFLTTLFFPLRLLGECMVFMIIYVWSRRNPDTPMSFFGACPRVHARRRARYRLPLTLWVCVCVWSWQASASLASTCHGCWSHSTSSSLGAP